MEQNIKNALLYVMNQGHGRSTSARHDVFYPQTNAVFVPTRQQYSQSNAGMHVNNNNNRQQENNAVVRNGRSHAYENNENNRWSSSRSASASNSRPSATATKPVESHQGVSEQRHIINLITPDAKGEHLKGEIEKRGSKRKNSVEVQNAYDAQQYQAKRFRNEDNSQIARSLKFSSPHHDGSKSPNTSTNLNMLSRQVWQNFQHTQQTQACLERKMKLRAALLSVFQKEFPACTLHLVGSSTNGLAVDHSDADFCLLLNPYAKIARFYERTILRRLHDKIQTECPFIKRCQLINAKVPILKLWDSVSGFECDININNTVGIRNTHLMRAYAAVDPRVRPLVMIIKKWAKAHGINDASRGTLSSYSLSLLVLHYLQDGIQPPVLPSLQQLFPTIFNVNCDINMLTFQDPSMVVPKNWSSNKQCVGELLLGFFKYYAIEFRWESYVINIKLGTKCPRDNNDTRWRSKYICVEEPFDGNCVARSVYEYTKFCLIQDKFRVAFNTLKISPMLESIMKSPKSPNSMHSSTSTNEPVIVLE